MGLGNRVVDPTFWRDRRVLVTGHTGFVGGWLSAWLTVLGAKTTGLALDPPTIPSFYDLCQLGSRISSARVDIRDPEAIADAVAAAAPEIVVHCAAQALVGMAHSTPAETFATNLMGTVHILEAVRRRPPTAIVLMTSDKVYADAGDRAARESDALGGNGAYAASKACCEIAVESYAQAYFEGLQIGCATIRAGNVIGGGDWAADRIIPDAIRAFSVGGPLVLRRPGARRPWQHVLDAVSGILLAAELASRRGRPIGAFNIGPHPSDTVQVRRLAQLAAKAWGEGASVSAAEQAGDYPETELLALDSNRARRELGWFAPWAFEETVSRTIDWYRAALSGEDCWSMTLGEIAAYEAVARSTVGGD